MTNVVEFSNQQKIEEEASLWIVKFEGDDVPSAADIEAFRLWLKQSPRHENILKKYCQTWEEMNVLSELAINLKPIKSKDRFQFFRFLKYQTSPFGLDFKNLYLKSVALCFCLTVILMATIFYVDANRVPDLLVTSIGEQKPYTLSDGSVVWLNTNSKLRVSFSPAKRKIELLQGEVHFKVAKNKQRPFEVYVGERLVRAVGTAFSVYKVNDAIKVLVNEGRVEIAKVLHKVGGNNQHDTDIEVFPKTSGVHSSMVSEDSVVNKTPKIHLDERVITVLAAGQSVVLDQIKGGDQPVDVVNYDQSEITRQLSWKDGLLVFSGDPLIDVVSEISRYSSLTIDILDPDLKKLRIGGQFKIGKTDALFDILNTGFGLKVSKLDAGHYLISRPLEELEN